MTAEASAVADEDVDNEAKSDSQPDAEPQVSTAKPPILPKTCEGWQRPLSFMLAAERERDILNAIVCKEAKQHFLGFSHPFSSAWLTAIPSFFSLITNDLFLEAFAARVGVPLTLAPHPCRCDATGTPTVTPVGALQHAHSNSSDASSNQNGRHEVVKKAFTNEFQTLLGTENVVA